MIKDFDADVVLSRLKDFQLQTVNYVFRRLYTDSSPATRFLVADEVGLGKTMVARGVIALALSHLKKSKRITIVYICSNAAIAHQNVARLNVTGAKDFVLASRLTLLPAHIGDLRKNPVNFVSFTPGTTFDLKSQLGKLEERALIFRMLRSAESFDLEGLSNVLQGNAGPVRWHDYAKERSINIDEKLSRKFQSRIKKDAAFKKRIKDLCQRFRCVRSTIPSQDVIDRAKLVGELRHRLALICLDALKPDLIILDEFQRFRDLLQEDNPSAALAQELFKFPDARILLLSATPYKMYSLDHEQDDDHYPDFINTLRFLFHDQPEAIQHVEMEIRNYRLALMALGEGTAIELEAARSALMGRLRAVMCRTERVAFTTRQDAMISEPTMRLTLNPADLKQAQIVDGVSQLVKARDSMEFWKSAPYALNFMKGYQLRHKMAALGEEERRDLAKLLNRFKYQLLDANRLKDFHPVDPANSRLRALLELVTGKGQGRILWMPPSMPYWQPYGAFSSVARISKTLVFSAWNVVPDAIAALCSYEVERTAVETLREKQSTTTLAEPGELVASMKTGKGQREKTYTYSKFSDRFKPRLRFALDSDNRLTGMPTLMLQYPSPTLAAIIDPVALAIELSGPISHQEMQDHVQEYIRHALNKFLEASPADGQIDERWYWAAAPLMDKEKYPGVNLWLKDKESHQDVSKQDEDVDSSYGLHLKRLVEVMSDKEPFQLGRPPADLLAVLAELALAGPAVCALRSLRRVAGDLVWDDLALLRTATAVGAGFRTLFNVPESVAILRADDSGDTYWRLVLRHGMEGNLSALLDEQVHVLKESLGCADDSSTEKVQKIGQELKQSLSIRTSQVSADILTPHPNLGKFDSIGFPIRCRFALRFGDMKDEKAEARVETVRSAFNSPFRPFVLASTSIGQEGLDFHVWCHSIVHWNLPTNPVDLEQREGRVHRYKGHAVRKNVALDLGLESLKGKWQAGSDPWQTLFDIAHSRKKDDLLTYWLYESEGEGASTIERWVPLLPLSREKAFILKLKRGLALYRLVFGQPRQEDLLSHLSQQMSSEEEIAEIVSRWRIDLSPPKSV